MRLYSTERNANRRLLRCFLFVLLGLWIGGAVVSTHAQAVKINEFLASNGHVLADEDGEFEDWIELYNPTTEPINLVGYTLTDNPKDPKKWVFPEISIQPKGFLLIWASGKDRRRAGHWDFPYPLILEMDSAGFHDGDAARILVNGEDRSLNARGLNVVRLDSEGNFVESTAFDTSWDDDAAVSLVRYLNKVPSGEILIIAVKDEASARLKPQARTALETLGSEHIGHLREWDSWGMISIVGQGKLVEDYRPSTEGQATAYLASKMTLHTNFKINKDAEYLALYSPAGTLIDSVSSGRQTQNVAFGRWPDGSENWCWCFFAEPTPNASNDTACASGVAEPSQASMSSGLYKRPITVTLTTSGDSKVHYTLDGSIPTPASLRYVDPLTGSRYADPLIIEETRVVRVRTFEDGLIPSTTTTYTYLINEDVHLPILSLVIDPVHLWDTDIGIYTDGLYPAYPNYVQRGREWERPVSVTFFEDDGSLGFASEAGIRIFGGTTREFPKKSFVLYFRDAYGNGQLNYRVFPEKDIDRFQSLIIRNAGNDGYGSNPRIRDPLMHNLFAEEGWIVSAKRSVFVYLNGIPWGIYNLRENIDKSFIVSNFSITDFDFISEEKDIEAGDAAHWDSTLSFFQTNDLGIHDNYVKAQELIDITAFTDFQIFQIYGGNIDIWGNIKRFRPKTQEGKWQWIMWDMDLTFGLEPETPVSHNSLAWHTRDRHRPDFGHDWADGDLWITLLLRKLLENEEYRNFFINQFADLLNTTLSPKHVTETIDSLAAIIEPDIPLEMTRWSSEWGGSVDGWLANVQELRDFAQQRPGFVRDHIVEKFGLTGVASLTIEAPSGEGSVRVNSILPTSYPWHGMYFQDVPVALHAEPAPGYQFAGWGDSSLPTNPTVTISLPEYYEIRAMFVPIEE